jgi:hypothetical protein
VGPAGPILGPERLWDEKKAEDPILVFVVLGLELRAFTLSHSTSPIFCDRIFSR